MKNSNENKYRNKLRASRTVNIVLSVLLILSVCIAPIFAAASNRFDVTGDGLVDTRDIVRMMKYIAGAIDEDGNPITPGDNDDSGDKPSVTPAYNTVSVNGVPVYSYSGSMWLYDENGSSGRDEETNKLIKDDSNKGKVYRVTVSKKLIDSSADGTVKDPITMILILSVGRIRTRRVLEVKAQALDGRIPTELFIIWMEFLNISVTIQSATLYRYLCGEK